MSELKILTGTSHVKLAQEIARQVGHPLVDAKVGRFSNGEISVQINESIRDCDCFIIQPVCNPNPNDGLMELLILVDALRRGSAARITAVVPHFGYARQDKKDKSRAPITAKLIATLMEAAGVDRVITVDLHASQIQGFFDIPVDNLWTEAHLSQYIDQIPGIDPKIIVSPDAGGVKRAKALSDSLELPIAIIHKHRKKANEVDSMTLVGDVKGHICILVDDMADTCGTLKMAAATLMSQGASAVYAAVTHGVLSGNALKNINESPLIEIIVTNTIPQKANLAQCSKLRVIDIAPMLAEAIRRTHNGEAISALFKDVHVHFVNG